MSTNDQISSYQAHVINPVEGLSMQRLTQEPQPIGVIFEMALAISGGMAGSIQKCDSSFDF